jgi:hypothetical protein
MADISVSAITRKPLLAYGETLHLDLDVANNTAGNVFVASNRVYHWKGLNETIQVLVGQPAIPTDLDYYTFIPPELRRMPPGSHEAIHITLGMPPVRSKVVNGIYSETEEAVSGNVEIIVMVGYLETEFRPKTLDPAREFVSLQKLSPSASTRVQVASL